MHQPPETAPRQAAGRQLLRATLAERWVHRCVAVLMGVCLFTAAVLYVGPLSVLIGRRALVEWVHVIAGIALPVPVLVGLVSRAFRADVRRFNRFTRLDWVWLRSGDRRSGRLAVGKFNAGQKLNAAFTAGAIIVMLGSGLIMRWANAWPVRWRTGATFAHDWFAFAIVIVIIGHLYFASRDPTARHGMRTGFVPESWARVEHPGWVESEPADSEPIGR